MERPVPQAMRFSLTWLLLCADVPHVVRSPAAQSFPFSIREKCGCGSRPLRFQSPLTPLFSDAQLAPFCEKLAGKSFVCHTFSRTLTGPFTEFQKRDGAFRVPRSAAGWLHAAFPLQPYGKPERESLAHAQQPPAPLRLLHLCTVLRPSLHSLWSFIRRQSCPRP
jgi:hypothetical protein